MIKHTPGPWSFEKVRAGSIWVITAGSVWIADIVRWATTDPEAHVEREANARLISAAPEMLDALKAARDLWGDYLPPGNSNAMKAMKLVNAAIAKATT